MSVQNMQTSPKHKEHKEKAGTRHVAVGACTCNGIDHDKGKHTDRMQKEGSVKDHLTTTTMEGKEQIFFCCTGVFVLYLIFSL